MSKRKATRYVGNTPGFNLAPKKKRKGSGSNYRIPAEARQRQKDKAYIGFQKTPRLNKVTSDLHQATGQCDTILGGFQIWLRGERPDRSEYKFPIVIEGERCEGKANRTFRVNGKNVRRCCDHSKDDYWIKDPDPDDIGV